MPKQPHKLLPDDGERMHVLLPDVTPIRDQGRAEPPRKHIAPLARQRLRDEQAALVESLSDHAYWDVGVETGDELVYLRAGLAADTLRNLRRGHWVVQGELDLHGLTTTEARSAVALFLHDCLRDGARCIRIIHGKGLRSKNREPVLKAKVGNWLRQRDEVLAYCQARQVDGGSGAVMVLLKAAKRRA
jgi:DNA-nicking Smr family endonuclease